MAGHRYQKFVLCSRVLVFVDQIEQNHDFVVSLLDKQSQSLNLFIILLVILLFRFVLALLEHSGLVFHASGLFAGLFLEKVVI